MPTLPKIEGRIWIGEKPPTLDDFSGKVVLVHFWTYSCGNCRRTIPHLREWREKYQEEDFVIIGIHTPEFEFESIPHNVEKAMRELGVEWPVVLDNEYVNWHNFENDSWPAMYLADAEGNVVYSHIGEGAYEETEGKIRELLGFGQERSSADVHAHTERCIVPTPDVYCGYLRGNIANDLGFTEENEYSYQHGNKTLDTLREDLREGEMALDGAFFSSSEYVESREEGAALSVSFYAKEVNLVLSSMPASASVEVLLNDAPLADDVRGADVDSDSRVVFNHSSAYNLMRSTEAVSGVIRVRARKGNFRAYAFTFSGCSG